MPKTLSEIRQNTECLRSDLLKHFPKLTFKQEHLLPIQDPKIQGKFPHLADQSLLMIKPSDKPICFDALRVGVVFSGGQAAGGHNVIAGLFDALQEIHTESKLFGFLNGPRGIIENQLEVLTNEKIAPYRNQGGFDLIGSGRDKIESEEDLEKAWKTAEQNKLNGLVIIGGDDSNTNAAVLAEYFLQKGSGCSVVGVPKTIDGDLKNEFVQISFGFDTAAKTYSETVGNIARDALSAKKYYFFIKMMGRSASHITLETALQTRPNMTLISEEIHENKTSLKEVIDSIADMICERAKQGKNYGVVLIPEGLIEAIPEFGKLIDELNQLHDVSSFSAENLSEDLRACFEMLSESIQKQLLMTRDPHGNIQVSKIETERFIQGLVEEELQKRKEANAYVGKFSAQPLFLGYEGRSCHPSLFDSHYCYHLGFVATTLIAAKKTGYMSVVTNLDESVEKWGALGLPLAPLLHMEMRKGKEKPVIEKSLVDLKGELFLSFAKEREKWALGDEYLYPGPIQFSGAASVSVACTVRKNCLVSC